MIDFFINAVNFFIYFYTSPVFLRLAIALFLLVYTYNLKKYYILPFSNGMLAIPLILIGRDILSLFVNLLPVYILSDAAILIMYVMLLESYNTEKRAIQVFTIVTVAVNVVILTLQILTGFPVVLTVLSLLFSMATVIWFSSLLTAVSYYNSANADFIVNNRAIMMVMFIVARFFALVNWNVASDFSQYIMIPLGMLPYLYFVIQYHLHLHALSKEREQFTSDYINSLFDFMRTIGSAMTERIEVKTVLTYVIKNLVQFSGADAGVVLLRDAHSNTLKLEIADGYFPPPFEVPPVVMSKLQGVEKMFESTHIKLGETILGKCAADNRAVYVRKVVDEPLMAVNSLDNTLFISSFMCIPLLVNKDVFGVLAICLRKKDYLFTELDFERAKVFAEYASITLDSLHSYAQLLEKQEIEREVSIAATIQKKLLPGKMPKAIQNMVAAYSKPAKGVSGDYYDIIPLTRAGKFALVICDVAGKGVPASLIMVMIRTIVHLIAGSTKDTSLVVKWINRGIAGSIDIERFATLSYMVYDPVSKILEYTNAAHHPAMHYKSRTKQIERIDSTGLPVGLERDAPYQQVRIKLEEDDVILVYTDGIIESLNTKGEQYEEERLKEVFLSHITKTPKVILDAINTDVDGFVGSAKQHDDMTFIVFKAQ